MVVAPQDIGLLVRVNGVYLDEAGALETIVSAPVLVGGGGAQPPPPPPPVASELAVNRAEFRAGQSRLRVRGTVAPIGAAVSLFAPGTANGGSCDGTPAGNQISADGTFNFDLRGVVAVDPGTVCVSANNGLAVQSAVTLN